MFEQIRSLVSGFCPYVAISLRFFLFLIFRLDFFLNGFPNSFIVHTRPRFLFEPNFDFPLVVFSHAGISFYYLLFSIFWNGFFSKWFSRAIHSSFFFRFTGFSANFLNFWRILSIVAFCFVLLLIRDLIKCSGVFRYR